MEKRSLPRVFVSILIVNYFVFVPLAWFNKDDPLSGPYLFTKSDLINTTLLTAAVALVSLAALFLIGRFIKSLVQRHDTDKSARLKRYEYALFAAHVLLLIAIFNLPSLIYTSQIERIEANLHSKIHPNVFSEIPKNVLNVDTDELPRIKVVQSPTAVLYLLNDDQFSRHFTECILDSEFDHPASVTDS